MGGGALRDPQMRPRPGERRRGARACGAAGAAWPGHGHQTGIGSWERRCCLGNGGGGVARRGWLSWERVEIKGEFNPFVARGSSSQSSPGLTGRGKRVDQSLIRSAPLTFHLLPASLQFWQGASVTSPALV